MKKPTPAGPCGSITLSGYDSQQVAERGVQYCREIYCHATLKFSGLGD
jgi:hypothetical protein